MARVLIVGCGCRGRGLATALIEGGHAVRGTTRNPGALAAIEEAGAEAVVADPLRLGPMLGHLQGVSALVWLMGSATGSAGDLAALHGPRLRAMLEKLVDTPVRGAVYEGAGSVDAALLEQGATQAREIGERFRMPIEVTARRPGDVEGWTAEARGAVERILSG